MKNFISCLFSIYDNLYDNMNWFPTTELAPAVMLLTMEDLLRDWAPDPWALEGDRRFTKFTNSIIVSQLPIIQIRLLNDINYVNILLIEK